MPKRLILFVGFFFLFCSITGALAAMGGRPRFGISSATPSVSVTARSGQALPCHVYWRVDANGRQWRVSLRLVRPPQHGHFSTRTVHKDVFVRGRHLRARAIQVVYKSKKGFVGEDRFTYLRTTKDPTDPHNGQVTIVVTVR